MIGITLVSKLKTVTSEEVTKLIAKTDFKQL